MTRLFFVPKLETKGRRMPSVLFYSVTSDRLVSWVKGVEWVLREALKKTQAERRDAAKILKDVTV